MSIIEAIILGLIQGLSEFIPISSTAHLTLAGHLFGLIDEANPDRWTAFIATIQLGTLLAVMFFFSKELRSVPTAFFKENIFQKPHRFSQQSNESRMGWLIIIGTIPVVVIGLLLKSFIEGETTKDPIVIASSLIGLALVLAIAEKTANFKKNIHQISIKDSILIGLAQCVALIPGSSRSGTTITAGLFLGINREAAARFSFLLSIPAIFGSGIYEFYQSLAYINASDFLNLIVASIAAAISGYASIAFLIKFLKTRSTFLFINYRIVLGIVILIIYLW